MGYIHVPSSYDVDEALCCRCSTILVRNRDRELFCVRCDMFLRPEQQAATPAPPAAPQTPAQENLAQTGQPEQTVHEDETHNSSGKAEAEAARPGESSAPRAPGCSRVLALLMETMEWYAEQLKKGVTDGDCRQSSFEACLKDIERIATAYNSVRAKCG